VSIQCGPLLGSDVTEDDKHIWACNLLDACVIAITEFVEAETPTTTDWVNLRAARNVARQFLLEIG
jgi:hypothetical protein